MLVLLELLDQPPAFVLAYCILLLDCRKRQVLRLFCDPRCCYRFPRNFSSRLLVPKKILRLGFVDLADHMRFILNALDLLEGTGIDWKILDSRSI